jgi:FkbM family methyltransferase
MSIPLNYRLARFLGHQHYIRRGRDRLIRRFAQPSANAIPFAVDFFGLVYRGDLSNFIDWSVYIYGAYSRNELLLLRDIAAVLRSAQPNVNFYDIGANVGQHTLFMSQFADRVISFEPFAVVRQRLEQKLADNLIGNVTLFPVALGSTDDDLPFSPPVGGNMGTGTFRIDAVATDMLRLPVRNGDRFLERNKLPRVDLLKIDVEGFECAVLKGMQETLQRDRPLILMELSGHDRSGFVNRERFTALMYESFKFYRVSTLGISGTYRLAKGDFAVDDEILIVPCEWHECMQSLISGP